MLGKMAHLRVPLGHKAAVRRQGVTTTRRRQPTCIVTPHPKVEKTIIRLAAGAPVTIDVLVVLAEIRMRYSTPSRWPKCTWLARALPGRVL
jgi:hypothetical protein